jgi:diacylglycerol O-acyltransferase / wax synthase
MERLSAQDLMMIWPEERGWAQDIGVLAILDGATLVDGDGRFSIELAREYVRLRLHLLPRFRQRLYQPRLGLGWPLWVDAPSVDLAEHVRVFPLPACADESQLLLACEELRCRHLNRSRPLWEMWFLTGLRGERIGLFMRLHHAIADGVSGIAALGAFFDVDPQAHKVNVPPWVPAPMPSTRELFEDNVVRHARGIGRVLRTLARPRDTVGNARGGWPAVREAFAEERAPRTSLNASAIGSHRRFAVVRSDLDVIKRIAHTNEAKVNDVLMTIVAGGLRSLLLGRGEQVEGVVLRSFVPVSLHTGQPGEARGNLDGAMIVPLPVGEREEITTLHMIATETVERRKRSRPQGSSLFRNRPIQKAALRLAPHQRVMNTYVANVPGPPTPLHFAGAPVLEVFPVVPLIGNVSVGVGALSYSSQFNMTAVADRDLCPDLEVFVDGMRRSLGVLTQSVRISSPPNASAASGTRCRLAG